MGPATLSQAIQRPTFNQVEIYFSIVQAQGRHTQRLHRPRPGPRLADRLRTSIQPDRPALAMEIHPGRPHRPAGPTRTPRAQPPATHRPPRSARPATNRLTTTVRSAGRLQTARELNNALPSRSERSGRSCSESLCTFGTAVQVLDQLDFAALQALTLLWGEDGQSVHEHSFARHVDHRSAVDAAAGAPGEPDTSFVEI
jgi:hypothetical protein